MTAGGEAPERVEGTGETVGEAKWAALRELERLYPGVDKASVRFEVLSEGERGLLGVGYAPARVAASLAAPSARETPPAEEPGSPAARLRELLEHVCAALGLRAAIRIEESERELHARLSGPDLGLLIGRRGQTIDAVQLLANALVFAGEEVRKEVVVDAAGYRDRRRTALERAAERAAREALESGTAVALEPMSATERKIVHLFLQTRGGVETASEGREPQRYVVVSPAR
ncbi:MAG: KH domain-containing protein [Actinomycetota bacterium]|nr:KH domain-containing protein [Actinomycetota bacterium]